MAQNDAFNNACSQLISKDDLTVPDEVQKLLKEQDVAVYIDKKLNANFKIYADHAIYLTRMTPLFRYLGFEIIDGISYTVMIDDKEIFVNRFNLEVQDNDQLIRSQQNITDTLTQALQNTIAIESKLFSLIYLENLSLRQIRLLQAFIEYITQSVATMSQMMIEQTLCKYHTITKLIIDFFITKFDPTLKKRNDTLQSYEKELLEAIKEVPYITDDQVLKLLYELLKHTQRTNYFFERETIALKIDTASFKGHLKGLQPNIESFVYSEKLCGIHLRMSRVSRGGLRHSERYDDYRQEIKSLMITQEGKNSIIVPDGAKGGFVIREDIKELSKERFTAYYSLFIHNLLDLIDNRTDGKIVHDERIVAYDGEDSYFVVAADKGTANMSDVANAIAVERGYWLGDAFASGGSQGYSHKELGITAKGAFKSTERFFIEKGIDFYIDPITVVGIGSMNGDVFGNGMLLSQSFRLLGAISHKEIFIDPDPIGMVSFTERQRLFMSKNGSWSDYNPALISKGGGVFLRSAKSIELSPQIQKMLSTTLKSMSGEELGRALLSMQVDLLFNGGVGTYVKSSEESNLDIGDKQNEAIRIDATELKAYAVCEGGNLGFTQKARIEFAKGGGKINVDGIDNSAGVNISDHEVNLKIILNSIWHKGHINEEEKNSILKKLDEKVVNLVLWNNYLQALSLSKDELLSKTYLGDFIRIMTLLEKNISSFNRKDFHIPKDENIHSILTKEKTLVRPVLASLLSYSKIFIKSKLLKSHFIDEPYAQSYLYKYFPKSFTTAYKTEIDEHPLKREIIATMIADFIINNQGILFLSDYEALKDEKFIIKIQSYLINNQLFGANNIRYELHRMDNQLDVKKQYPMLFEIEKALTFSSTWMVRYLGDYKIDANYILDFKDTIFALLNREYLKKVPKLTPNDDINNFMAILHYLRFSIAVITIKEDTHGRFEEVAELFYVIIDKLKIMQLFESLDQLELNDPDLRKERRQLRQIIELVIIKITDKIQNFRRKNELPKDAFENFLINGGESIKDAQAEVTSLFKSDNPKLSKISITIHALLFSAL